MERAPEEQGLDKLSPNLWGHGAWCPLAPIVIPAKARISLGTRGACPNETRAFAWVTL